MNGRLAALWAEVGTIPEAQGAEVSALPQHVSFQSHPESSFIGICAFNPYCDKKKKKKNKSYLSFINISFLSSNKFSNTTFSMLGSWRRQAVWHPHLAPGPGQ